MTAYEIESKIELDQNDFERLLNNSIICERIDQLNVYYDYNNGLSYCSATFRVRFIPNATPMMTLKLPVTNENGVRKSLEIECQVSRLPRGGSHTELDVSQDLPDEFATHLQRLGINKLKRIGWMRNRRWVVKMLDNFSVEFDQVRLPNGKTFFEVEIENEKQETHYTIVHAIKEIASSAKPSTMSKYERFLAALK